MPEETIIRTDVHSALDNLEDYTLDNHISRINAYNIIQNTLEKNESMDAETLRRLLAVCVHDVPTLKFTATAINIIAVILSQVKVGKYDPAPDLVPSALSIIRMLKTISLLSKVESLMALSYDTLLSYPEKTLIAVAENHEEVIDIFNLYCHIRLPPTTRLQASNLLHKLLVILPPEKRKLFVEYGISVWFSKIIPTVVSLVTSLESDTNIILEILELLTDDLIHIDYTDNAQWHHILECICNVKLYPTMMKNLLNAGHSGWYRLWIVFIKLLKHQITQSLSRIGTPINSMLPVVEAAFKLDVANRCKAFECWNVLIDSFATETNESNINKRLKLLIIPLKSNNAKTEETALAKFKCWWHLIRMFQNKMDKFLDPVIVSLLHFCFGKHNTNDRSVIASGQISANVSKHCNQAIVDMVGHINCDGCTDLPKLKAKLINTKHLVDNWNHWIYSLTSVIMKTANSNNGLTKQQLTCLWKSFLMTIGELPENNIRKDLFAEILSIVAHLVQECKSNNHFLDIAFNILILSLFDEDTKIKQLFKSSNDPNDPMVRIVRTVLDPSLYGFYDSLSKGDLTKKMKTITKLIFDERVCTPKYVISWVLVALPTHNYGLAFWNALAESLCESNCDKDSLAIPNMLLWPLKSISAFSEVKSPAMTWYTTYDMIYPRLHKIDIDKSISDIIFSTTHISIPSVYFKLCVVLGILKHKFSEKNCTNCEKEINLLLNLTKIMNNYENYEPIFPVMIDRIVSIMSTVTTSINDNIAALILVCIKNVLQVLTRACRQESDISYLMILIGSLLKPLEKLFAVESYSKLIPAMTYHLLKLAPLLFGHLSTQSVLLSVMKTILLKTAVSDTNYDKIKCLISDIERLNTRGECDEKNILKPEKNENKLIVSETKESKFITPDAKEVPKRTQKKEPNIVNTVVENGEEYVVVKSNWRFNPRKLTEHQKEKLQRKREDIPALYQDLSQSQDEFKLVSWKPDSQDTSSSSRSESKSSKPSKNETATEILKNLPSTNVVPKIMENIFSEKEKEHIEVNDALPNNIMVSIPTPKTTKSPRMALKDRVFRNVRHLIGNSAPQKENQDSSGDLNKADNNFKTPTHSNDNNPPNIVYSAPPLLSADRPSRVKRKPKKFEDLQLLASKKNRLSLHEAHSGQAQQHSDKAPSSKSDTNIDSVVLTSATENIAKNKPGDFQEPNQQSNVITDMDITHNNVNMQEVDGNNDNNTNKNEEMEATEREENQITLNSDIIMSDNDRNDSNSYEQTVVSKSKDDKEVLASKSSKDVSDVLTPTCCKDNNEVTTAKTPEHVLLISKMSENVKKMTTLKKTKTGKESACTVSKDPNEVLISKTSKDVKELPTPKTSKTGKKGACTIPIKDANEILITKTSEVVKELPTPKTSKASKEVACIVSSEDANEVLITKNSKDVKELFTPKTSKAGKEGACTVPCKDVEESHTSKSSKAGKEVEPPISSTPSMSKDVKVVSTPKTSKPVNEVLTPKMCKVVVGVSTPTTSKLITDVSTPSQSMDNQDMLTSKTLKHVPKAATPKSKDDVKEVSTPKSSKHIKEVSTPKTLKLTKEVTHSLVGHDKEVSHPGMCNATKEVSTPEASEPIEEVSTPEMSKNVEVFTAKSSKGIKEVSTPTASIDNKGILTPKASKDITASKDVKELTTPKQSPKGEHKSTAKKPKKSRIEKELAIDTVEGHPYLKIHSAKRLTRKALESVSTGRRKSLAVKLNKSKFEGTSSLKSDKKTKEKNTDSGNTSSNSIVVCESQEKDSESKEDSSCSVELPFSDDVIESSQDSTITTISVKSTKKMPKKVPVVCVEKLTEPLNKAADINYSQSILDCVKVCVKKLPSSTNHENKDDSVLPLNKTALEEKSQDDLTENMDTEPLDGKYISVDVIVNSKNALALTIAADETIVGPETEEIADADTQAMDPTQFMDIDETPENIPGISEISGTKVVDGCVPETCSVGNEEDEAEVQTVTQISASADIEQSSVASSPFKDEAQRQQDFLNNTIEISPIKTMSPDRHKNSPSPETSNDYVVILLSSPVHSNGEPFEKRSSPEVFTEDKISPDKRDQSPPRVEISVTNTSPSSSLSLKKNRPQVRSGGRAAQMLGLCVPDKVQAIVNPERNESEEAKKLECSSMNTPARRNLRILYNTVGDNTENSNSTNENDDNENFLRFTRSLPPVDRSPSVPILKRKLAEITDDAMISPASKRKRVSFHDPPVSTTISVQKYIEPGSLRSPQNSAQKRLERQLRQHTPMKSPKRLDNVFKLDTVLTKTVESFSDNDNDVIFNPTCATEPNSLDSWTPEVTIVRASELNDTDPICTDLVDCQDPIQNIAVELSSSEMKSVFLTALLKKITTIGDLAKMTELEVNRLFIRAPKVKVAKKVLSDYASKKSEKVQPEITVSIDEAEFDEPMTESVTTDRDTEKQTVENNVYMETEVQTKEIQTKIQKEAVSGSYTNIEANELSSEVLTGIQTDEVECELYADRQADGLDSESHTSIQVNELGSESHTSIQVNELNSELHINIQADELGRESHSSIQTDELTSKTNTSIKGDEVGSASHTSIQACGLVGESTIDIIKSCLLKKPDFVRKLGEHLEESSIQQIVERLPLSAVTDLLMKKITPSDTKVVLDRILEQENGSSGDRSKELSFVKEYICDRFDSKDLVLLCSQILKVVHDRPA